MFFFRIVILIPVFFLMSLQTFTFQDDTGGQFSALKTKYGILFIFNSHNYAFTVDVKCKEIREIDSEDMIYLFDNHVFQLTLVPVQVFCQNCSSENDTILLLKHKDYEIQYSNSINGKIDSIKSDFLTLPGNKKALLFTYAMPEMKGGTDPTSVVQQAYLSTIVKNQVLLLSSAIMKRNNPDEVKEFLKNTMQSLVIRNNPVSVEGISDSLKLLAPLLPDSLPNKN